MSTNGIKMIKENINTEEFFKLPQEERLKIIIRHVPLKIKIPFFTIGVLGILTNCLTSAFAGTVIFNSMLAGGYTDFWARFLSLAFSLFSLHILNEMMNRTSHWLMDKYTKNLKE